MKFLELFGFAVLSLAAITSSKKEDSAILFTPEGTWTGKIGTGSAKPDGYFGIVLKAGGTLERLKNDGSVSATGNWKIKGNKLSGAYTFGDGIKVNFTTTIQKSENKISGTWTNSGKNAGSLNAAK